MVAKGRQTRRKRRMPGQLRGHVSLRLHSIQAVHVFCGRRRTGAAAGIPGLYAFVRAIASVGERPNPKGVVFRINVALRDAEVAMSDAEDDAATRIQVVQGLTLDLDRLSRPQIFDLRFRSTHAFRAARLIGRFDRLVTTLMTLNHVGALDRRGFMKRVDIPMRRLRHAFNVACDRGETRTSLPERRPNASLAQRIADDDHAVRIANV